MTRILLFLGSILAGLVGVGWMAVQRWDSIAYLTGEYSAVTGWAALGAAWPVFVLVGLGTALVSLILSAWIVENAREQAAETREKDANERIAQAEKTAQNAREEAEAAISERMRQAEIAEQRAREREAVAEQARHDAQQLIAPAQQRLNELAEERALLQRRLEGALEHLARRKRQVKELSRSS